MKHLATGLMVSAAFLLFAATGTAKVMTNADLEGTYYAVQTIDDGGFQTAFIELTFDGVGTVDYTETFASTGVTASGKDIQYAVSADGRLSLEDGALVGAVSPSGNYIMFSDMTPTTPEEGGSAVLIFGMKAGSGRTVADPEIPFTLMLFGSDSEGLYSETDSITLDGAGGFASSGPSGTYTIDATTGKIELVLSGEIGEAYEVNGILSPDGNAFIAVDTDNSDGDVFIIGGIKNRSNLTLDDIAGKYYLNEFELSQSLGYEAYFSEITLTTNDGTTGSYTHQELQTTCECPPTSSSGTILAEEGTNNAFSLAEDGADGSVIAGFSADGELFAASEADCCDGFLGIGIVQADGVADDGGDDGGDGSDLAGNDDGGSSSDGGCFVRTMLH